MVGADGGRLWFMSRQSMIVLSAVLPTQELMRNPLMTKNPFMSAWLSSANKVMGSARGQATSAAKRQATSIQSEATKQVTEFWLGKPAAPAKRTKRR